MQKVAIIAKVHDPRCNGITIQLLSFLAKKGVHAVVETHLKKHLGDIVNVDSGDPEDILLDADLVIVLGGDGTLIGAVRSLQGRSVPILAVNLGSLGFLTEVAIEEAESVLARCLEGDFTTTPRMMLQATVERDGKILEQHHVLNDVVINKGALARIIDMTTFVDGEFLTLFKADGLIISTPTGSTGYSLSAGGPIIHPSIECMSITPICPHILTNRPVLAKKDSVITLMMTSEIDESVYLTLDGQIGVKLQMNDKIHIIASQRVAEIIRSDVRDYYQILRTKLKWGER